MESVMRGIKKRSDPTSRTVISRFTRWASRAAGEASDAFEPEEDRAALLAAPFPLVSVASYPARRTASTIAWALSAGAVTVRVFFNRFTATSRASGSASTARSTRAEHAEQLIPVTSKRRCARVQEESPSAEAPDSAVSVDSVGLVMVSNENETQSRFENLYAR